MILNARIELAALLEGAERTRSDQVALFAFINLGIVESLSNGLMSAAEAVESVYHAENCLFVRKKLRVKAADEIMRRVQSEVRRAAWILPVDSGCI